MRSTLDRSWAKGFVVEAANDRGYRLRRRSDGSVLPAPVPVDAVRPADRGDASSGRGRTTG